MPLTLNLLHEEQRQLQQRKRDPLKLGLMSLGGVALLFVAYYAIRMAGDLSLTASLQDHRAQWAKLAPQATAAEAQQAALNRTIAAAALVTKRIEGRFYVAPLLEAIFKTVPPSVQITGLTEANDPRTDKVTVALEGVVGATDARLAADQFRKSLVETLGKQYPEPAASFRSLEDDTLTVNLDGKSLPTAKFAIDVQIKKPTSATPTPEATAPRRRR